MKRGGALLVLAGFSTLAGAQDVSVIADRHTRIGELYKAEKYAAVIREVDAQLSEVPGTPYADSLAGYLYKYARAHRKVKDAAAGAEAAERIYALVKQRGNADREIEALFDLSWYYYDIGELKQCARVDSLAVLVADGDPKVPISQRGRARQYLAFDYSVLGDHRRSAKYALEAIAQYEKADTIPPAQWAESYTAAGVANWHMGRIRDAEAYYLKALGILGDGEEQVILIRKVSTNGNLGVLWQNAGDFTRAKKFYHTSLRFSDRVIANATDPFERDEAVVNRSRTYLNLATIYHQLGDHGRARELLEIAYKDRSSVLEPDDPQLLVIQDRLADVELSAGNLEKAGSLTTTYLVACERKFGTRSEEYIRAASKLGDIAARKGEFVKADSLFAASIAAGRANTDEATDAVLAQTLQSRAQMRLKEHRYAEAMADLTRARDIQVRINDSAHYKVADADTRLAEATFAAGDARRALVYSLSALSILDDRVRSARSGIAPQAFPDPHILPDAIYWRVRAGRALGEIMGAEQNELLDIAVNTLARNKSAVGDEASKLLLIGAQKRLFDFAIETAYEPYAASGSERDLERFLRLAEADRSILLKGRLNAFAGIRFAGVPDSLIEREQELIAALDVDERDRATATEMDMRERAYAEFIASLEKDHPQYFALRYGEPHVTLGELRNELLTPDRDLLAYAFTDAHLHMLVLRVDTAVLIRVPNEGVPEMIKALNIAVRSQDRASFVRHASALHDRVFEPVAPWLQHRELLIIPDGDLQTVNFETLLFDPVGSGKLSDHMLIQKYAIAYLLSATTAVQFAGMKGTGSNRVLAFAPGFSDELKRDYVTRVVDSTMIDRRYLDYVRQPFAVSTAEALGSLMNAQVNIGSEASEARFREQANEYGILHLGTHAEMNASSPMYSRLVFSKDGSGVDPDADGYLHAYDIYELDLRAQLAVLTACETGAGTADVEGVRSLGYGFAYAGCPSLVMSLWSIDEKVSSEIITRFYEHLADGMPKHLALRQAKLDHLANAPDELALPYYWAGLVLVGDVSPVETIGGTRRYWFWLIAGIVSLGGLLLILRRRRERA